MDCGKSSRHGQHAGLSAHLPSFPPWRPRSLTASYTQPFFSHRYGHSSSSSYDSEEERWQARQHAAARSGAERARAACQAALLDDYRERQRMRAWLQEEALQAKLRPEGQQADPADGGDSRWDGSSGGAWACGPWPVWSKQAAQEHERRWAALESTAASASSNGGAGPSLSYDDFPWPPEDWAAYLATLARAELQSQPGGASSGCGAHGSRACRKAARRAYARACLRYHPDKFQHRWGRLLADGERQRVLAHVAATAQGLNAAWEAMQAADPAEWEDG